MPIPQIFQGHQVSSALPERTDNPLPPALSGEIITPSKLHALRRTQLRNLARAYSIKIPENATKNQILPSMISAEEQGVFRRNPTSQYYYLMAMRDPDVQFAPHDEADFRKALEKAERAERIKTLTVAERMAEHNVAAMQNPDSVQNLRKRAKALGISTFQKSREWLLREIPLKEAENEALAAQAQREGAEQEYSGE